MVFFIFFLIIIFFLMVSSFLLLNVFGIFGVLVEYDCDVNSDLGEMWIWWLSDGCFCGNGDVKVCCGRIFNVVFWSIVSILLILFVVWLACVYRWRDGGGWWDGKMIGLIWVMYILNFLFCIWVVMWCRSMFLFLFLTSVESLTGMIGESVFVLVVILGMFLLMSVLWVCCVVLWSFLIMVGLVLMWLMVCKEVVVR